MDLFRGPRKQIETHPIRGRYEWREEHVPSWGHSRRFGRVARLEHQNLTVETSAGYNWGQFSEDSLIVDVGAGVGTQTIAIAKKYPQLRFVVQDRESVMQDAAQVCAF